MTAQKRAAVYIGRFSLFHEGHAEVLKRALLKYSRVIVIVGSANQPRTIKNPWTADERMMVIKRWRQDQTCIPNSSHLIILTSRDYLYNNQLWLAETQKLIKIGLDGFDGNTDTVWVTGSKRDDTGFYLDLFPRPTYELDLVDENESVSSLLSATWCREIYLGRKFNGKPLGQNDFEMLMRPFVPESTINFLREFSFSDYYSNLVHEHEVTAQRRAEAESGRYPRIDVTVDNVVIQSGHILLIKRRSAPGKGLWALPGGYLNPREWTIDGAIRELKEETMIDCPLPVLKGSMALDRWFEHPDRSNINRVITHVFCFKLPDHKINGRVTLPKVIGSDDASRAKWFPLNEALNMSDQLFDDHHAIIEEVVGSLA